MYRPSRRWREEHRPFGPRWPEEAFGQRMNHAESAKPKPSAEPLGLSSGRRLRPEPSEPEEANAEEKECRGILQRLKADFINYKRRVEREREEQTKSANRELILKLLPLLDDLSRALGAVPQEMADADWVKGMALIERKLVAALEEEGLKRIDAEGKDFDPWEHEAVFCERSSAHDEGKVKAILRDGYRLHDRVIRPAQVVVSKGNEQG